MKRLPLALFSLSFFLFLYAPLLVIIGYSFNSNPVNMLIWDGFTLDWYKGLFGIGERLDVAQRATYIESTPQLLAALKNSLIVAASKPGSPPPLERRRHWRLAAIVFGARGSIRAV